MNWLAGSKLGEARKLVKQLGDNTKRDRATANLLRLGSDAAPALIEALHTKDQSLIPVFQQILVHMGSAATPALLYSLANDHPLIRGRVAEVLAKIKDPVTAPALLTALHGEYFTVRSRAALALAALHAQEAVQALIDLLKDLEPEVRIAAVTALGEFNLPETFDNMADPLLEDNEIEVRQAAAKALGATKHPEAIPYLMLALRDPFWWYEREDAVQELLKSIGKFGNMAIDPLLEALNDKEGTLRKYSASLLGQIGDPRAIEPLSMALYDTHFEVGQAAATSLAGFGPVGLKILAEALHHPEAWLRQHAISGLTLSGDKRIVPVIVDMLNDPEREVQKQAIAALGQLGDVRALPALQAIATNRADREMYALAKSAIVEFEK